MIFLKVKSVLFSSVIIITSIFVSGRMQIGTKQCCYDSDMGRCMSATLIIDESSFNESERREKKEVTRE